MNLDQSNQYQTSPQQQPLQPQNQHTSGGTFPRKHKTSLFLCLILIIFTVIGIGARQYFISPVPKQQNRNALHLHPKFKHSGRYYVQSGKVYYDGLLTDIDAETFSVIGGGFAKDGTRIYWGFADLTPVRVEVVKNAEPRTFTNLGDWYGKDDRYVFVQTMIIDGADPKTFEYLGNDYSKDAANIYLSGFKMPDADPKSFTVLGGDSFAKDDKHVYFHSFAIPGVNPRTFKFFGYQYWTVDGTNVQGGGYGTPITGADAKTFINLNDTPYSKDAAHVWYEGIIVQGADPKRFELIDASSIYAKDSGHVYISGSIILGADLKTFTIIGVNYTKDADHVYWAGSVIPGADPKTFTIVSESYAKDKAHVYNEEGLVIPNSSPSQCRDNNPKGCESKTPSSL